MTLKMESILLKLHQRILKIAFKQESTLLKQKVSYD